MHALLIGLAAAGWTLGPAGVASGVRSVWLPAGAAGVRLQATATPTGTSLGTDDALASSLKRRMDAVNEGAGRRYRVVTTRGFLNVHSEPGDPFNTANVVCQLDHGAVVESLSEDGVWVCHDGGGWSIRVYGDHQFLVPVE